MADSPDLLDRATGGDVERFVRASLEPVLGTDAVISPMAGGVMNTVFEASAGDRDPVVVRVAQRPQSHFADEKDALDALAGQDLPVPEVLALDHYDDGARIISVIVLTKLPGKPMGARESIDSSIGADAVHELGAQLGRIHIATGDSAAAAHTGWLHGFLDDVSWAYEGARRGGVDRSLVDAGLGAVRSGPKTFVGHTTLRHNDFKAGNILVHEGRISGIVDFEFASRGHPVRDLAFWAFWHGIDAGAALREGYETVAVVPADVDECVTFYRLEIALSYLGWFARSAMWPGAPELVMRNIAETLAELEA